MIKAGELVWIRGNRQVRVLGLVPVDDERSPYLGLLKVEARRRRPYERRSHGRTRNGMNRPTAPARVAPTKSLLLAQRVDARLSGLWAARTRSGGSLLELASDGDERRRAPCEVVEMQAADTRRPVTAGPRGLIHNKPAVARDEGADSAELVATHP
jgi:hypothetical protein